MNEVTWFVIFGLGFDIVGAVLILKPLLFRSALLKRNPQEVIMVVMMKNHNVDEWVNNARLSWAGLIFLLFGFALQMIGNWYQNPLSL